MALALSPPSTCCRSKNHRKIENVRSWHKADVDAGSEHVCFQQISGHPPAAKLVRDLAVSKGPNNNGSLLDKPNTTAARRTFSALE